MWFANYVVNMNRKGDSLTLRVTDSGLIDAVLELSCSRTAFTTLGNSVDLSMSEMGSGRGCAEVAEQNR